MAPEYARIDGFRGDARSDMFSFGVLACQVITGILPFPPLGEHPEIAFIRRWTGPQPPRAQVPRPVAYAWEGAAAFLARALNPDREARFPSFQAAREALAGIRPRVLTGGADSYALEAFLASGGFCDVFRARAGAGGQVAVKRLHAGRHEWRFRREAGLLQSLHALAHPALVRILDLIDEPESAPCLVMEFLPGEDLRRRLASVWESGQGLPAPETVRLFIRYLEGLEALHAAGIAHRDIKPANLYAPAGKPEEGKLLDLGVACEQDGTVSMQGMAPGTLDYMAPELASGAGGRGTPQSDLFALGCSLYEALTGRSTFHRLPREEAAALRALCGRSETGTAFSAAFTGFDAPVFEDQPVLAEAVAGALEFDPADRYGGPEEGAGRWTGAGARAMRQALREWLDSAESVLPAAVAPPVPAATADSHAMAADPTESLDGNSSQPADRTVTLDGAPSPPDGRTVTLDGAPRRPRWPVWSIVILAVVLAAAGWALRRHFGKTPAPVRPAPVPAPVVAEPTSVIPEPPVAEPVPTPVAVAPPVPDPVAVSTTEPPRVVIKPAPAEPKPAPVPVPAAPVPEPPDVKPEPAPVVAAPAPVGPTEADLAAAESSIRDWRVWLSRLDDPLLSATLRRYQPGSAKPAWRAALPYLLAAEREALPEAVRGRFERSLIWEQTAREGSAGKGLAGQAAALRDLSDRVAAGEPALAGRCRFEARLLDWDGQALPEGEFDAVPEAAIWRLHALAAEGDDQDARAVLKGVAAFAERPGADFLAEDALLAVRAGDLCLGRAVAEIRDKTAADVVAPGSGRAVRDPVAAYAGAVNRLRAQAVADAELIVRAARATGTVAAAGLKARLEQDRAGEALGDWLWSLAELDATPWAEGRKAWAERVARLPGEERAILAHLLGKAPLPARVEDIPVARLRAP
jgi:serine/threonine protein kinase